MIGEVAAQLPEEALASLPWRISPLTGRYLVPEEFTIRRVCKIVDAKAIDLVINSWIADQLRAGRFTADASAIAEIAAMAEVDDGLDENRHTTRTQTQMKSCHSTRSLSIAMPCVARASARATQTHLLSAMTHSGGEIIAQRNADTKSNDGTGFRPLLEPFDLADIGVTADALPAQGEHARWLVQEREGALRHWLIEISHRSPRPLKSYRRFTRTSTSPKIAPRYYAAPRNVAISFLRVRFFDDIGIGLRSVGWDHTRRVALIGCSMWNPQHPDSIQPLDPAGPIGTTNVRVTLLPPSAAPTSQPRGALWAKPERSARSISV